MSESAGLRQRVAGLEMMDTERQWGKEALPEYPERLQEMVVRRGVMNKRILIVEDSLIQSAQLKDLLQEHGYWVTVATNGQEGLAAVRERKPDLIISDVIMPGMDGYEMCQAIKHNGELRDIPIILLTVPSDTKDIIRALQAGVDYYLTKPYYENHLLSQVESALARPVRQKSKGAEEELEVIFGGERHVLTSDRQQMLNLLLSTYDDAVQQNRKLIQTQRELQKLNEKLQQEIIERKQAEEESRRLKDFNEGIVQGVADGAFGYVAGARVDDQGELVTSLTHVRFGKPLPADEVDLSAGAYLLSADLARRLTAPDVKDKGTIAGRVWLDTDRDGLPEPGAKGLAGLTVRFEKDGVEVGRALTGADGSYISPPLPAGEVAVVCEAGARYIQTTPSSVELSVAPRAQAAADFGLWAEEKPGRNRYRLRATANESQAFTVFTAMPRSRDRSVSRRS